MLIPLCCVGLNMKFNLSYGIYKMDQHKKISLMVFLFMSSILIGAVYITKEVLVQTNEESVKGFFCYLYSEQKIFSIFLFLLMATVPFFVIKDNSLIFSAYKN